MVSGTFHRIRKWERFAVYAVCTIASIAIALLVGKDISWDQTNYHVYAGLTAFDTRLDQDFMPASIQSYLNRLSFVPFMKLAMTGMESVYVAAILAVLQSVGLWCCYEISLALPRPPGLSGRVVPIGAVVLAALSSIYLIQVGSPANDLLTAVPVLAAWACMLKAANRPSPATLLFVAGLLLGMATGLKLTQGIFAVASTALFCCIRPFRFRHLVLWGCAGLIGFILVDGWWAYQLWKSFGNPVFPMFNGFFKSPDYGIHNIGTSTRWLVHTIPDFLLLPFRMALPVVNRYTELSAPDIRYAAAIVAMLVAIPAVVFRRSSRPLAWSLLGTGVFFLISWTLWQLTSGQGRYLAPIALATGPLLLGWLWIASASARLVVYSMLVLITVQTAGAVFGTTMGRPDLKWAGPWLRIEVPAELRNEPHLILSGSAQTYSAIIAFVHPDSSIVSIGGQTTIQPNTPGAARLAELVTRFGDKIVYLDRDPPEAVHGDVQLFKLGLETGTDCKPLQMSEYFEGTIDPNDAAEERPTISQIVCPVHRRAAPDETYYAELKTVRAAADAVMRTCPQMFSPDPGEIDGSNGRWKISFPTRDTDIVVVNGQLLMSNFFHPFFAPIGTLDNWSKGQGTVRCELYPLSRSTDLELYFTPEEIASMRGKELHLRPIKTPSTSPSDGPRQSDPQK
ncbi:hypothetical protein BH10PSE17_BH10PSE17_18210 [soil metagenome]